MYGNRTMDGRPLSVGFSGMKEYSTHEKLEYPLQPTPIISLEQGVYFLQAIRDSLADPELERLISVVKLHLAGENPHGTNLSDFTEEVIDVLYLKYTEICELAGEEPVAKDIYISSLFSLLRIATIDEIRDRDTDPRLLVSIGGARQIILDHDLDDNAHLALFDKLFPGTPFTYTPLYSIHGLFGVSPFIVKDQELTDEILTSLEDKTPQLRSYVDSAGTVKYSDNLCEFPMDYKYGAAAIPCFGTRINYLLQSHDVSTYPCLNLLTENTTEVASPDNTSCTVVKTSIDSTLVEHILKIKDVELKFNQPKSFSVFAKAGTCRYLAISYKDMEGSGVVVRAVYDLVDGLVLSMNHMNRYDADITPLQNGWKRCEFNMMHEIGQISDIEISFFKIDDGEDPKIKDMAFLGVNEICGYLWGVQLEDGFTTSPYIPTTDKPGYRIGQSLSIPITDPTADQHQVTCNLDLIKTKRYPHQVITPRTLVMGSDSINQPVLSIHTQFDAQLKFTNHNIDGVESMRFLNSYENGVDDLLSVTLAIGASKVLNVANDIVMDSPATNYNSISTLHVGWDGDSNYLDGYIHNVKLYDVALTLSEIKFLHGENRYES